VITYVAAAVTTELARVAAEIIGGALRRVVEDRRRAVFAIPGGRSAAAIFSELRQLDIPWKDVHIFMADERLVPLASPESNYAVAEASLVAPLRQDGRLPPENVHPFAVDPSKPDVGLEAYARTLDTYGGVCDVVLLSAGEDGHVASLFPGHSVMDDAPAYVLVSDAPKPPPGRMSMSRNLLRGARVCVVIFSGESKREAYRAFRAPEADYRRCPVVLVKEIPEVYVVTDLDP
jgi:6-phosphogluconolactonase